MKLIIISLFIAFSFPCFSQTDSFAVRNSLKKLENDNAKLSLRIDELYKNFDNLTESNKVILDSLETRLNVVETTNRDLVDENATLKKEIEAEINYRQKNIEDISSQFSKSNLIGIIISIIIGISLIFLVIVIVKKFKESNKTVEEKALNIDKELLDLMSKQINLIKKTEINKNLDDSETTVDHSFAIRVADEINRISMRLVNMDDNSRDVAAVRNALKRMESELNQQGYEIIIRNGDEYKDTLTFLPVNFVAVEGLKPGEQKIHRTIKPQIIYKSRLIQQGEIEVGVNENDLV